MNPNGRDVGDPFGLKNDEHDEEGIYMGVLKLFDCRIAVDNTVQSRGMHA